MTTTKKTRTTKTTKTTRKVVTTKATVGRTGGATAVTHHSAVGASAGYATQQAAARSSVGQSAVVVTKKSSGGAVRKRSSQAVATSSAHTSSAARKSSYSGAARGRVVGGSHSHASPAPSDYAHVPPRSLVIRGDTAYVGNSSSSRVQQSSSSAYQKTSSAKTSKAVVRINNRVVSRDKQDVCRPGDECWGEVKCICAICDCGQHHCPIHHPKAAVAMKFNGMSEAQAQYVEKSGERARAIRHKEHSRVSGGKFVAESEARLAYVKHKVVPPPQRVHEKYHPSGIKFEGQSENRAQYTEKQSARAERVQIQSNLRVNSSARFNGVTTAAEDFTGQQAERAKPYKPEERHVHGGKFRGTTENHEKFREYAIEARKPKEKQVYKPSGLKLETETEAHAQYTARKTERTVAYKPKNDTHATGLKFEGVSTAQQDFVQHEIHVRQPIKAVRQGKVGKGKFVGQSEYRAGFVQHEVVPPAKREPVKYQKSNIKFQGTTEARAQFDQKEAVTAERHMAEDNLKVNSRAQFYDHTTARDEYVAHEVHRQKAYRPKSGGKITGGKFRGVTENHEKFREYAIEARKPKEKQVYKPSGLKLETETEAHAQYTARKTERTVAYKPKNDTHATGLKFEGVSTAQQDFVQHEIHVRQPIKAVRQGKVGKGKFVGQSEYRAGFVQHEVVPPAKREPVKYQKSNIKFQGTTEARAQFDQKEAVTAERHMAEDNLKVNSRAQFYDHTTARDEYVAHEVHRQKAYRPKSGGKITGGKFRGVTENHEKFREYAIEARKPKEKQVYKPSGLKLETETEAHAQYTARKTERTVAYKPKNDTHATGLKFEGVSTAQQDFVPHEIHVRQPIKAVRQGKVGKGKFVGQSEYRAGFVQHEVVPPAKREPVKYQKSNIKFQGTTEARAQFDQKEAVTAERHMAEDNLKVNSRAQFYDHTTARDEYVAHEVHRQKAYRPKSGGKITGGKFRGVTENHAKFVEYEIAKREKAAARAREDHIKFGAESRNFITESHEQHNLKEAHVCPATYLRAKREQSGNATARMVDHGKSVAAANETTSRRLHKRWKFLREDATGHEWYCEETTSQNGEATSSQWATSTSEAKAKAMARRGSGRGAMTPREAHSSSGRMYQKVVQQSSEQHSTRRMQAAAGLSPRVPKPPSRGYAKQRVSSSGRRQVVARAAHAQRLGTPRSSEVSV